MIETILLMVIGATIAGCEPQYNYGNTGERTVVLSGAQPPAPIAAALPAPYPQYRPMPMPQMGKKGGFQPPPAQYGKKGGYGGGLFGGRGLGGSMSSLLPLMILKGRGGLGGGDLTTPLLLMTMMGGGGFGGGMMRDSL